MTIFLLALEVLSWKFDRVPGQNALNYFFNLSFAWLTSLVTCMFASYIDYHIFGSYERLKKRWFYIQPFIVTGILLIINFFLPIIFSISTDNVYHRESLMILLPIINLITFIYVCYLAYKERAKIKKEVVWVLLLYVLMPAIAAFFQVAFFGVFILWPIMAITVAITYIFLETISTSTDYLTGLLSRHRIDDYLEYMLEHNKDFTLIMIDLNKFKCINDKYGHINGDLALKVFSKSLYKQFGKNKVIGRYAGDEFLLILEKTEIEDIVAHLKSVERELSELYNIGKINFLISFCYGYYEHTGDNNITYNEIIHIVDQRMYLNK
jgi:diguanylate cyclase (GGDEF)-like protein